MYKTSLSMSLSLNSLAPRQNTFLLPTPHNVDPNSCFTHKIIKEYTTAHKAYLFYFYFWIYFLGFRQIFIVEDSE